VELRHHHYFDKDVHDEGLSLMIIYDNAGLLLHLPDSKILLPGIPALTGGLFFLGATIFIKHKFLNKYNF